MTDNMQPSSRYPHIDQALADQGKLPETVARWVSPQFSGLDHAKHLDAAIAWGSTILRFPSVRNMMRNDATFWQAYAQLRLAWWLSQLGVNVLEFEPRTIGEKRADIRCRFVGAELDLEVFSPAGSVSVRRDFKLPKQRLLNAFKVAEIRGVDIELENSPQASYQQITEEVAGQIAQAIAQLIQDGLPDSDDGVVLSFSEITVSHNPTPGIPDEFIPDDEPLRIRVAKRIDGGASLLHGHDVMAYLRGTRPGLPQDEGDVSWLTSTLREEAGQLDPDRVNGIWIEGTHDEDLFSLLTVPWGVPSILDEFWPSLHGTNVDFVGFFELAPGLPYLLPGVRAHGGVRFNPNRQMATNPKLNEAFSTFWDSWNDRVIQQLP